MLDERPDGAFQKLPGHIEPRDAAQHRGAGQTGGMRAGHQHVRRRGPAVLVGVAEMDAQKRAFAFELHAGPPVCQLASSTPSLTASKPRKRLRNMYVVPARPSPLRISSCD